MGERKAGLFEGEETYSLADGNKYVGGFKWGKTGGQGHPTTMPTGTRR